MGKERLTPLAGQAAELTGTGVYAMWEATMAELHGALFTPGPSDLDVDLALRSTASSPRSRTCCFRSAPG